MLETQGLKFQANIDEVILISNDDAPHSDILADADLSTLASDNSVPRIESVKHASKVLEALLSEPPRAIACIYQLDDLHFSEMRSNVLRAGIVVLAVQAGHHAIVAPISTQLSAAHWHSEFIFRAVRGIHLLKPELSEQQVLFIVTQEIHFYTQHPPEADSLSGVNGAKRLVNTRRVMPRSTAMNCGLNDSAN